MHTKRIRLATTTGAVLGIFCIIGISVRLGFVGNELFIFSTWINRVVMGFAIGFAPYYAIKQTTPNILLPRALFGLIFSGSFFLATEFRDVPGFFAGIVYGIIIDYVATKYGSN